MLINKITFLLILLSLASGEFLQAKTRTFRTEEPMLIMNMEDIEILPRNFRMTTDEFDYCGEYCPSTLGIENLNNSGSAQFSQKSFKKMLEYLPKKNLLVVDLREESHGFADGHAMSWYGNKNLANLNKPLSEIIRDENQRLKELLQLKTICFFIGDDPHPATMDISQIQTEKNLVESCEVSYIRIPVTDHRRPTDETVDSFIKLIHSLSEKTWIHYHCSAGKGRTSTFMVLNDIIINSKLVSFEHILSRQKLIGGKDFWILPEEDSWKYDSMMDRVDFLQQFYNYCSTTDTKEISWIKWLSMQSPIE